MRALCALTALLWPVAVCVALRLGHLPQLLWALALLFALRAYFVWRSTGGIVQLRRAGLAAAVLGVAACLGSALLSGHELIFWYPVLVNVLFLSAFGISLIRPPSMAERFARIKDPEPSPALIRYTRNVTAVWCVFFAANGSMALFTVLAGDELLWMWWNGCWSYVAMGTLMGVEYFLRITLRRRAVRRGQEL